MSKIPAHKTKIMVHCLATPPSWGQGKDAEKMVEEVRRWHVQDRGWRDIAYAEIIDYEGRRAKGRDLDNDGNTFDDTGAGARGHNSDTIHLALAGGRWPDGRWGVETDRFEDHFTPAQDRALREAIEEINALAGRKLRLLGHNEVAPKGCPAFDVGTWWRGDGFTVTRGDVREVQHRLRDLGYHEVGKVDGIMGRRTKAGILAFRDDNDLPLRPEIDEALVEALRTGQPRPVPSARAQGRPEGSRIVTASTRSIAGSVVAGATAVGPALVPAIEQAEEAQRTADRLGDVLGLDIAAVLPWVAAAAILFSIAMAWRARAARIEDHQTGKTP